MVKVSIDSAATEKSIGSEYTTSPFGIITDTAPLKVRPAIGDASMLPTPDSPPLGRAIAASVIGRSVPPKVFDI